MSAFDNLKRKAKDLVETRGDKIAAGVDKATDLVDKRTKGKYHDKLEKLDGMAKKKLDRDASEASDAGDVAGGSAVADGNLGDAAIDTPVSDDPDRSGNA